MREQGILRTGSLRLRVTKASITVFAADRIIERHFSR